MARKRASMREGPLAELFRATEAAQKQAEKQDVEPPPTLSDQERLVLDGLLERLDRSRHSLLLGLRLLLLALRGLRRPEELGERALTHAGALSRH